MKRHKLMTLATVTLAATATATALTACGTETGDGDGDGNGARTGDLGEVGNVADDARITGIRWVPESITVNDREMTRPAWADDAYLEINPGTTPGGGGDSGGLLGCNRVGADVEIEGDTLQVTNSVSTRMACGDFEGHLVDIFLSSPRFELSDSGDSLTLTSGDGNSTHLVRPDQTA
jgi:heat shock protein HslJ